MNKKTLKLGKLGETLATNYLENKGLKIVAKNFHTAYGEIDIIATDNDELVFFEVKTRSKSLENAISSISMRKQQKIKLSANIFLSRNPEMQESFTRFDVILIIKDKDNYKIKHIKDAFR